MIASINRTKEILSKYDLYAKKGFGQNFLIDSNIIDKIVASANIDKKTGVIEIGPGLGALTEKLCINAKKVLCYEIDEDMVKVLNGELKFENLCIKNVDFLKASLEEDFHYFDDCERVVVTSNLPYYITTPIIFKLLETNVSISSMFFMVQKEVALRLTGKPNTKDYNSLSVLINYKAEAKLLFNVGRNCFLPSPDVESAIIMLSGIKSDYTPKNEANFLEFIRNLFCMRRKTVLNNISSKYPVSKDYIRGVLNKASLKESVRAEELDLKKIIELYQLFGFDK